jgi:hypothetical protein
VVSIIARQVQISYRCPQQQVGVQVEDVNPAVLAHQQGGFNTTG